MRRQDNSKPPAVTAPDMEQAAEARQPIAAKRSSRPNDALVLLCILIVSAAAATMLFVHAGVSVPAAALAGAGVWMALMLVHRHVQKSARIAHLEAELARMRAGGVRLRGARPTPPVPSGEAAKLGVDPRAPELSAPLRDLPRAEGSQPDLFMQHGIAPDGVQRAAPPDGLGLATAPVRQPAPPDSLIDLHLRPAPDLRLPGSANEGTPSEPRPASPSNPEPAREQWAFRLRAEPRGSLPIAPEEPALAARGGAATTIEGDLELVQRKIKELADEVNSTTTATPATPSAMPPPVLPDVQFKATAAALEDSIGALKAAAGTMRERRAPSFSPALKIPPVEPPASAGFGELVIPSTATRIAASGIDAAEPDLALAPSPDFELPLPEFPVIELPMGPEASAPPSVSPRTAALTKAIENDAADVFLGPIVTLSTHSVGHYEMTVGLKSANGERLGIAEDDLSLLDEASRLRFDVSRLKRAAALSLRMEARDKDGALLTEFTGASLISRPFLEAFAQVYEERPKIASQLVLTFSQRAISGFTPAAWEAVRDMHAFGFRFALGKVETMNTDLAAIAHSGFCFVRIDAQTLLLGMSAHDRFVSTAEIHQRATLAGLSIVATGIGDTKTQARLLESGIQLGQGTLFGSPRQVSLEGFGHPRSAAA
jgi:cyclic-di-GMP phosphodiesterase TipF (flagellum assembly factor)